jgi:ribosome-dependent ATPase
VCGAPDELKEMSEVSPSGTRRLEVDCFHPTRALEFLRHTTGVVDATLFGQSIHLLVAQDLGMDQIRVVLDSSSFQCQDIREIGPSLEDVFVMLTRLRTKESNGKR